MTETKHLKWEVCHVCLIHGLWSRGQTYQKIKRFQRSEILLMCAGKQVSHCTLIPRQRTITKTWTFHGLGLTGRWSTLIFLELMYLFKSPKRPRKKHVWNFWKHKSTQNHVSCDTQPMKPKIRWSVISRPHLPTQFVEGVRVLWFQPGCKGELFFGSAGLTHAKTLFDIISTTCWGFGWSLMFCFDFSASWLFLSLRKGRICAYALDFLIAHRWWLE